MTSSELTRTVLQFMLADRSMPEGEFTELCSRVAGRAVSAEATVGQINALVEPFSQKLVKASCEVSGAKWFVLVSTADPPGATSALPKEQVDYFYHLLDVIVTSGGSLELIRALNSANAATKGKLSLSEAEKVVQSFVSKRLLVSEGGRLFLSALTVAELGPHLADHYSPESCPLCRKLLIYGPLCPHCDSPVHRHCLLQFSASRSAGAKCPKCKGNWNTGNSEVIPVPAQ